MRNFFICIIWTVSLCFALPTQAKITVALIVPMVDEYQQQGKELTLGVERAVAEINQQGGVLKQKISLLKIDDQCNDSIAISTAQMLTILHDKKVSLVIGPYCANSFDKVADIYAKAKIFQIIPTAVDYKQAKTIKKGLVKMLGYTDQAAKDFFAFYNGNFAGDRMALVSNLNDEESMSAAAAIEHEFQSHGKSAVLQSYNYQMTEKNYAELAEKILEDGAQLAYLLGSPANIRKMAAALRNQQEDFVIFINKTKIGDKFFETLGDLAEGIYFMELKGTVDDPEFVETLVKLRLSGFEAEGLSLYGYSAVKLWLNLVQKSKSFDYDKLSASLNNKTIRTEFGYKMFYNGAPKTSESYSIYRYHDGNFSKAR